MADHTPRVGLSGLWHAFDEARFGPQRTLNLRASLPTVDDAVARAEAWLRQKQVERAGDVLIVTGRGNQSDGGISLVRQAVIRLLHMLKRRGVIAAHEEHTPGSFVVTLAPVAALWESPRRSGGRGAVAPVEAPASLEDLDTESLRLLRDLAERALEGLGLKNTESFIQGEMLRQFGALAATIGSGPDRERRLRVAIRTALDQYE